MGTTDELVDDDVVAALRRVFLARAPRPPSAWAALAEAATTVVGLPLRRRVDVVRDAIVHDVDADPDLLHEVVDAALADPDLRGWAIWPLTEAVAEVAVDAGRGGDDDAVFEEGLERLRRLTGRLSAEFALRIFLEADVDRTVRVVQEWCTDEDEHVRRLASEGTRSHLPWGRQVRALLERPELTVPIVDALRRDDSEYVRRSVGNHVNDLSRRHPGLVVDIVQRWLASPDPTTPALVRRSLRTLVKAGDARALAVLGFGGTAAVSGPFLDRATVRVGEDLEVRGTVRNTGTTIGRFSVDYVVHYRKASGRLAPKTFKLATPTLGPGEERVVVTRRSFAPRSTRTLHPGRHGVELQVNGQRSGTAWFDLVE